MNTAPVNRTPEHFLIADNPVPVIEKQAGEYLVSQI
jgi:hypothetical protein